VRSDRRQAARLLSGRSGLCVIEKEEILRHVLRETGREKETPGRRVWMIRLARTAAAVMLLAVVPLVWWWSGGTEPDGFSARGVPGSPYGFELTCTRSGQVKGCRPGGKLLFRLEVPQSKPYFSAFSHRQDKTAVWYFPGPNAPTSIDTTGHISEGVLDVGIELGGEHPPGEYRVFGLYSRNPLQKEQIRSVFDKGEERSTSLFVLTERTFTVEP